MPRKAKKTKVRTKKTARRSRVEKIRKLKAMPDVFGYAAAPEEPLNLGEVTSLEHRPVRLGDGKTAVTKSIEQIRQEVFDRHADDHTSLQGARDWLDDHRTQVARLLKILDHQITAYDELLRITDAAANVV